MAKSRLRALTFLAPNMLPVYRFRMERLGRKIDCKIELTAGADYDEIHHDPAGRAILDRGFIDHFVAVSDADYNDIRAMLAACEQANFLSLK